MIFQVKYDQITRLVAACIKRERIRKGLTQESLADKAGLNYKFYQRVESGRSNLTLKTISKICTALKIKPDVLFK